jgi:hypothetical protein
MGRQAFRPSGQVQSRLCFHDGRWLEILGSCGHRQFWGRPAAGQSGIHVAMLNILEFLSLFKDDEVESGLAVMLDKR